MNLQKRPVIRSKKLRDSARGEECTVRSPWCNYDPDTTVLAHLPDDSGTGKMGGKSDDWCSVMSCSACHDWLDRRINDGSLLREREIYMRRAMIRTWRRWIELGLIKVEGMK